MNKSSKVKRLLLITISLGSLFAQTYSISGYVLDSKTNEPIKNVNIYVIDANIGTITNTDGYFLLTIKEYDIEKNLELNIKMIGYEHKSFHLDLLNNKIELGKIYLKIKSLELESVHIHSHKNTTNLISDISLGGQKLKENITGNIATSLSKQSNIGVSSFGSVTSKPVLRGYSGDRFLLTKDGNKIGDLSQTSIDHAISLDMTEVSNIEIVRGPKSLIFGSNVIGGVINTSMFGNPKVKVDRLYYKINLGGESYNNSFFSSLNLYVPIEENQLNLLLNYRNTGTQTSPIGKLENTYSETSNLKVGYTIYKRNNYLNFIIENYNMDYGIPPSLEGHIDGVDIVLRKNSFQLNYHQDISLKYFNQFDVKYNFIDYEHKEFENNLDYYSVLLSKYTHNLKCEFKSSNTILGSEFNIKYFVPGGFYWTPKTDEIDVSGYGFHKIKFDTFDLLGSFRMGSLLMNPDVTYNPSSLIPEEVRKRKFDYFSSSIGIRTNIDKIEIDSWIMNTMKAPRIEELYSDGPHLGTYSYEIGEPNLQLEKIYGIESSLKYNSNSFKTSLTTFYNYSPYYYQMVKMGECAEDFVLGESHPCEGEDFIEWGSGSSGWLYKYHTKGVKSLTKGLEFNIGYYYKNLNVTYDFSLVRGDDLTNNQPLAYINPDKHILKLDFQFSSWNYQFRFSKIHSQNRLGEFETFTPSAFLIDLVLGYKKQHHSFTIQVNNILNKTYYNHLSKIKNIMPEAGRNIVVNYTYYY